MRLPSLPVPPAGLRELPLWPPLLATRGAGSRSTLHAHHAMHLVLAQTGQLRVRTSARARWLETCGVLTAADAAHEIDACGVEVLLVFLDPQSEAGTALAAVLDGPIRSISDDERAALVHAADPLAIMRPDGVEWTRRAIETLGAHPLPESRVVDPRVRRLLRLLRESSTDDDDSLHALAKRVRLSPSRLMHVFTSSIGVPVRPYLAWLRLQRAAAAIVAGAPMAEAAHAAGFADAAHMSRTFRRMFGVPPSALRPMSRARAGSRRSQFVQARTRARP